MPAPKVRKTDQKSLSQMSRHKRGRSLSSEEEIDEENTDSTIDATHSSKKVEETDNNDQRAGSLQDRTVVAKEEDDDNLPWIPYSITPDALNILASKINPNLYLTPDATKALINYVERFFDESITRAAVIAKKNSSAGANDKPKLTVRHVEEALIELWKEKNPTPDGDTI